MTDPLRLHIDTWGGTPPARKIAKAVEILHGGGVAAYPTDSVYALGCAIEARDAIERIHRAKGMAKSQRLALICPDLSSASQYGHFNQTAFRLVGEVRREGVPPQASAMSPQFLPCAAHVVGVQPHTPGRPPPPHVWGTVQTWQTAPFVPHC